MSVPTIEDILNSIEENKEDVYSLDESYRTSLRDSLEYYDEEEENESE